MPFPPIDRGCGLRRAVLAHVGLADAIRQLCRDVSQQMGIEVQVTTRTVILTADDDATLRDAALAAGAAAFVAKSRIADDLLPAILNAVVPEPQPFGPTA